MSAVIINFFFYIITKEQCNWNFVNICAHCDISIPFLVSGVGMFAIANIM